jgi:hypothetical protein
MFSLVMNGIALTLFATSMNESVSSVSQVLATDSFNVAEAGLNLGLLRVKALMEANDPIDPSAPFSLPPFNLASEGAVDDDKLDLSQYQYFDLVSLNPLGDSAIAQIASSYCDDLLGVHTSPIDGFFIPETSNPDLFRTYLTGAEPVYSNIIDTGQSTALRGWRIYLANDNDSDDKTARLVAVGYLLDPTNNLLFQKKIEAKIYIHGQDRGKSHDPSGQATSSERGARTGKFRVTSDMAQPVNSYDLR